MSEGRLAPMVVQDGRIILGAPPGEDQPLDALEEWCSDVEQGYAMIGCEFTVPNGAIERMLRALAYAMGVTHDAWRRSMAEAWRDILVERLPIANAAMADAAAQEARKRLTEGLPFSRG